MALPPYTHTLSPDPTAVSHLTRWVGNTPLLTLERIGAELPPRVRLMAKAEWFNPGGSVKDRPAVAILQAAQASGQVKPDTVLLDSTSGNMGIAYATFGAALGLRLHLAIPANASPERLRILRALGVDLTLTDPTEGSEGARRVAAEMADAIPGRYLYLDQYSNPANPLSHYRTTGPEMLQQTRGEITHFVAGLGTTGTMTGAGRFLREHLPRIACVAVQPDGPLHGLEGLKHLPTTQVPSIFDDRVPTETRAVSTESAYAMARRLAREEGLLVGVSAAAAAEAALQIARRLEHGLVVALFPDSGWKYLDSPFWSEP
jgi:S-sulfo-L-cysteine synthase (O-acetyl-L-serine-dependent)